MKFEALYKLFVFPITSETNQKRYAKRIQPNWTTGRPNPKMEHNDKDSLSHFCAPIRRSLGLLNRARDHQQHICLTPLAPKCSRGPLEFPRTKQSLFFIYSNRLVHITKPTGHNLSMQSSFDLSIFGQHCVGPT